MIADLTRPISAGGGQEPLDIRPSWPHGKAFLFEDTWAINAGRQALRTPGVRFGVSKKGTQGFRAGSNRDSAPALGGLQTQEGVEFLKRNFPQ
ncbi:MAG: hypothetical protein WBL40_15890 [Terrimicrobiaceae bacterium]|jgi:hypothetical protein